MSEKRTIAYTGDDLIEIGRTVNRITKRLKAFEAYSGSDIENYVDKVSVDVLLDGEFVGRVGYEDGWLGFYPAALREEENTPRTVLNLHFQESGDKSE